MSRECQHAWFNCCRFTVCIIICCIGWSVILFLLIFCPKEPKITVTDASLTQFSFTNTSTANSTLYYNFTLNITINKWIGINYHRIRIIANYRKKRFALVTLSNSTTPFYRGHKNTTILHDMLVQGQRVVKFGKIDISEFNKETAAGVYSIDVQLALRVKARFGKYKTGEYESAHGNIDCKLTVPLSCDEIYVDDLMLRSARMFH